LAKEDGVMTSPSSEQSPIEHYGVIGDCRTAALVSRHGAIDWLCLPDYSSASIFAGMLDPNRGGTFSIAPRGPFTSTRKYLGVASVIETTFETTSGRIRLIDLLPIADGVQTLQPMREMLRVIEGISGTVDLEIRIDPQVDYGRGRATLKYTRHLGWSYRWSSDLLVIRSELDLERTGDVLRQSCRIQAGQRIRIALSYARGDLGVFPLLGADADRRIERTVDWWQAWTDKCTYQGPYRQAVLRSALTLKLLNFSLSGAIIAAPTTSLPEAIGAERNWDYRYCWLRDAGLTLQAFMGLGFYDEARSFLSWLLHATRLTWPELQVVYDVFGRTNLREWQLDHLEGYRGSKPVRVGNGAYSQTQLDVYGEVILAADAYVNGGGELEPVECRMLAGFGKVVRKKWREPDHGIWERRDHQRHHTFSKLMCWLALDRLLDLERRGILSLGSLSERFRGVRQEIADVIEQRGFNRKLASYTGELDGDALDASLLLMPCLGYRPLDPGRFETTYQCITERLGRGGLLYRYERGGDTQGGREGAFGICSFWAVHNLAARGKLDDARRVFEHVLSFGNDLGLFGEEIDPDTGAALGNFPQAFTHVGLINAALAIERARSAEVR